MKIESYPIRKRFGQNFLCDQNIIEEIINIIKPQRNDHIIEIGPGKGALTIPIIKFIKKLDVIEIDKNLANLLKKNINNKYLTIYEEDALKFNYAKLNYFDLRIIGNLPYNISTPLLFHLLSFKKIIKDMLFMLQKEVVDRICAQRGTKEYGRLSVTLQYYCEVESKLIIGPEAFHPAPKVDSAIIRITPRQKPKYQLSSEDCFEIIVREAFSQRRKTLRNGLKKYLNETNIKEIGIPLNERAENLKVKDFVNLSNLYYQSKNN
jgi:16S rRNA (adenine1518-N6/adenine1519-N6)-dimethyltransferase